MPRRTKEQKLRAAKKKLVSDSSQQDNPVLISEALHSYFRKDLTKSFVIILAIIALEFVLYYGTMNNQLSFITKLGK